MSTSRWSSGFNYRLTDLQCALGLSQLGRLERLLKRRAQIAERYTEALAGVAGVTLPAVPAHARHAWHIFPVLLDLDRLRADRRTVLAALRAENVGAIAHYVPAYWHPHYQALGYRRGLCPRAEAAWARLVTLPLFPAMTDGDAGDVIAALGKVAEALRAMRTEGRGVAFVTHGGPGVGLGHVRRCLALAAAWSREGARTVFATPIADGHAADFVRRAGIETIAVPWDVAPGGLFAELLARGVAIAVVDSYAASSALLVGLGDVVEQVVVVDDLADRPLPADVVVNGGIAAGLSPTIAPETRCSCLARATRCWILGLLRSARESRDRKVGRVLIAFGCGRQDSILTMAVAAARRALPAADRVHVMRPVRLGRGECPRWRRHDHRPP